MVLFESVIRPEFIRMPDLQTIALDLSLIHAVVAELEPAH